MKEGFQRFWWRMEQNKYPPIVEGPRGRGEEVVQWSWAWGIRSYVLAWIKRGKSFPLLLLGQGSALVRDSAVSVPLTKTCLAPQQLFPIKNPKRLLLRTFQLYRITAWNYITVCHQVTKIFPQRNPKYVSACAQFSEGELVPAAPGVGRGLQREDLPLSCHSTASFQWLIPWLLSAEPPIPLESLYCLRSSN